MTSQPVHVELTDLPEPKPFDPGVRRAPSRGFDLGRNDTITALANALRYVPSEHHEVVAPELLEELQTMGRIYGYRYRPAGRLYGRPIDEYSGRSTEGRAMQVMIDNNLDFEVALYPYELVTYGESGQVCQNWMQYLLIKRYLELVDENQTLVVSSGHPVGLFPSPPEAPRAIVTNGLMVGMFDTPEDFHRLAALGCVNYGQMTAGGCTSAYRRARIFAGTPSSPPASAACPGRSPRRWRSRAAPASSPRSTRRDARRA
jgi:urocanate hydratase